MVRVTRAVMGGVHAVPLVCREAAIGDVAAGLRLRQTFPIRLIFGGSE